MNPSASTNSLQSRLIPQNQSGSDLKSKIMGRSGSSVALKPKGMMMGSRSAAALEPLRSETMPSLMARDKSGVFVEKTGRALSSSQSAAILNSTGQFAQSSYMSGMMEGDDGSEFPPPTPFGDASEFKEGREKPKTFLGALNLTDEERYALAHVPNTFYYLRIKSALNTPVPTGNMKKAANADALKTQKSQKEMNKVDSGDVNGISEGKMMEQETGGLDGLMGGGQASLSLSEIDPASAAMFANSMIDDDMAASAGRALAMERASVYDLEVVPQDYINKEHYFTLSKEGVTIYKDKAPQFTPLEQWERESRLFNKISNINFFRVYRRWKAFKVWRDGLRGDKRESSSEKLKSSLFLLCAPLRVALLNIRSTSMPMASMGMLSLPPGHIFDIEEFTQAQSEVQAGLRGKLDELSGIVLTSARQACDDVVDQFLKSNNIAANHKMTFMERAALRSECRRLTRFLRMVDIMMADFLMTMIKDALEKLVKAHEIGNLEPRIETADSMTAKLFQIKRSEEKWRSPLFRLDANFKKDVPPVELTEDGPAHQEDYMIIQPVQDKLVKGIDHVINSSLEVVCSFVKVLQSDETEMYVMPEGDDEDAEEEELPDMATIIRATPFFSKSKDMIHRYIRYNYNAINEYCHVFDPFRKIYFENEKYAGDIAEIFKSGEVEQFEKSIKFYKEQIEMFSTVPRYADVGAIFIDSTIMKSEMIPSPMGVIAAIREWLPKLAGNNAQELLDLVGDMNPVIGGEPGTVEAFVNKKKVKDVAAEGIENYKAKQSYIAALLFLMDDNDWTIPDSVKATTRMLKEGLIQLEANIASAEGKEEEDAKRFATNVTEECPALVKKVGALREQLDNKMIGDVGASNEKVLKFLQQQKSDYDKLKARSEKLQEYQGILKLNVDEFEVFEDVGVDLNLKLRLWKDKTDWATMRSSILATEIHGVDLKTLDKELQRYNRTVFLSAKGLPSNKVVPTLKSSVEEFNPVLPLVIDLGSECLKDRHWDLITDLVGVDIRAGLPVIDEEPAVAAQGSTEGDGAEGETPEAAPAVAAVVIDPLTGEPEVPKNRPFTLFDLIDKKITNFQEEIQVIATSAQQESILEEMMAKVTGVWEKLDFVVVPYKEIKDLYVLGDTSDVTVGLDDSLVTINTVLGSRYVAGIREYVDTWRAKLMHFQETLDEWQTCQRNWMYLETIFGSADIIRQLPGPAKTFQAVDKSWKFIMKQTNDEPNALSAGTKDKSRLDLFRAHNSNLDQIQKDLEDYLETKRMAFPRFYFLSNDELLEILSQAKEPRAVQPHLRKCFDNLVKLEFGSEEGSVDLLAMFSGEGERVPLGKNLKARGNVEEWLTAVEQRMKSSLHLAMKAGLLDYDQRPREEWIRHDHPGQVVATVAQMTWARETEKALRGEVESPSKDLQQWSSDYKEELQKLIILIRGSLSNLERMIVVALVTTDVHARDIIDDLQSAGVESPFDFLWQQQLRYYWTQKDDDCIISHSDAKIPYGYEYMGACSRLVITPLTDRCWLTLTGSYALKLGAAPAGPAGTGKTESSKDLAKAIGIQCVVFNCSDQIDYKMMGKLFRGLAQGGSWICLDEFNRIDIEVLSVIAQQLLVLREGRQAHKETINFMGITIPLVDHHVIITMNPGYAGRTELPDNLAVCFRPVSMMVPNYALIAEIMLFAEGFGDAKNLSRKMCKLYILCSEQLSQQPHYDYGLRAVKSVLVMAGGLKRSNPDLSEDLVLIRALRDSNVPKFLADDLPLFAAIVQDLFPGVEIPTNDYGELQVALEEEIDRAGMQKVPKFINKVIQMFDIFNIRFGATIVGPAGTGKSMCYKILAALMTNLRDKGSESPLFQKVKMQILNPKCITMGELYGEFHPLTQEWHDGLASQIMRDFVAEESDDKRWTVFDGPIDALWIENMNTVLDDNMTLCLANGQRIKLKSEMKCLFEVNDLSVASPATVSRIGVVYMTPTDLGWMPYVQSWVVFQYGPEFEKFPSFIRERLLMLFEGVFQKGMAYQRRYVKNAYVGVGYVVCLGPYLGLWLSLCYVVAIFHI